MGALRDKCAIVGTGKSRLGKIEGMSAGGLLETAIRQALDEAGLKNREVDGMICQGPDHAANFHQAMGQRLGINAAFSTTVENGGASQILAVILAVMAIDAGLATTVVCGFGSDRWTDQKAGKPAGAAAPGTRASGRPREFGPEYGQFGPVASHALGARRHMSEYGTTREDFAAIAIAFREHAQRNPDAIMREPMTLESYFAARMVVDPFGLFDCCLVNDGAGAVVVTSAARARDLKSRPALIKGFGSHTNSRGWIADDNMLSTAAAESSARAYAMAGLGPRDVDVAQLYDCFTYVVLAQLEDYGFCKKGEGGAFARSGALRLDGALPTNTSGGQLSEAHLEGMLQVVEATRQLQGVYGPDRQVPGAEISLAAGHGAGNVCHSTLILGRA